jgi:hypothetical protein
MESELMKQLEPTKSPKHPVRWESMVRGLYETSPQTEFAAANINVIDYSFCVNEVVMYIIFDVLVIIVDENKITDSRIFSMDETSHIALQRPEKIIPQKGKHQV